jgi:hypothetical protein
MKSEGEEKSFQNVKSKILAPKKVDTAHPDSLKDISEERSCRRTRKPEKREQGKTKTATTTFF